mmetsp:Transcript_584/g.695  ORF Transcript_584/g.695 Transcript_584/m.695 type:complete len:93 (+) Transcript_584:291-569(+)|eukprot:CAMPEP_0197848906 /NCGR_PEP_ID=MMETSP1438-20131217/10442_1 /TAXON_ID=1461541 /ORGANISM="Pterosperma sp., Strain CCMP1384" /LENGTH=92 /DNA_ID=CAMNT_0043461369 /DNA_START=289 /DNA_END=567 /DNA_ORIENTATION=+
MFGFFGAKKEKGSANIKQEVARIKPMIAQVIDTTGATLMVTELQCTDEGCPPFDTVMAVLREDSNDKRVLHCKMEDVTAEEVARVWNEPPQS